MARAASRRETMNDLLRIVYPERMRLHQSFASVLAQEIPRENYITDSSGQKIHVPAHVGGGGGFSFTTDGSLPPHSHQDIRGTEYNYSMATQRISFSGDLDAETSRGHAAEKPIVDLEMEGMLRDTGPLTDIMFHGDGTAKLASITGASDSRTLTVDAVHWLRRNLRVDIVQESTGDVGAGVRAVQIDVNPRTNTIAIQATDSALADWGALNADAASYAVYLHASRNIAPPGLSSIVSDLNPPTGVAHLGGIDRTLSTNEWYCAQRFHNGGVARPATWPLIQDALDSIKEYMEGDSPLILCGNRVWIRLAAELVDRARSGTRGQLHGWADTIFMVNTPIVRDPHCPPCKMYLLDPATFVIRQLNDGQWMKDPDVLSRIPDKVAYEASWWWAYVMFSRQPNASAVIEDLDTQLAAA